MKIEKELSISANEFYDKIINSVIYDIRQATGKKVTRNQLQGFDYVKEFSKTSRAKIKIEEVIENHTYQFKTATTKNEFVVRYELTPKDDNTCHLIYTENMESFGIMQRLNDMMLGIVLGYFKRRQFKKMLEMMEASN